MRMQILILIVSVAAVMDIKSYKIKNWLSVSGILIGTCFQIMEYKSVGILYAAAGIGLPIFCLWILFCLRAMGAGDIKLFSVAGCFLGPKKILDCMLYALMIGGIFALCKMLYCRNIRERFRYFIAYIKKMIQTGIYEPYYMDTDEKNQFTIHFSPAILISVILLCWEELF